MIKNVSKIAKKALCTALSVAAVCSMTVPAYAVTQKVNADARLLLDGFAKKTYSFEERAQYVQTSKNETCGFVDGEWELKRSGNEIRIALHSELFRFDYPQLPNVHMRTDMLKNVGFKVINSKNIEGTIKKIELDESKSAIRIQTVDYYSKLEMTDVELEIVLTLDGKSFGDVLSFKFSQAYENHGGDIEATTKEIEWAENTTYTARATVPNVLFWGNDEKTIAATKNAILGGKYYFAVDTRISEADKKLMAKHAGVDYVYTVHAGGMENSTVKFANLKYNYHVYDEKGAYLGTTANDSLPIRGKYYLATRQVNISADATAYVTPELTIGTGGTYVK